MTQQIDELLYKIYDIHGDLDTEIILRSQFEHLEAQLKQRDEEIERLKAESKKARSIVAMLFWE